jgi:hypothetical protein
MCGCVSVSLIERLSGYVTGKILEVNGGRELRGGMGVEEAAQHGVES